MTSSVLAQTSTPTGGVSTGAPPIVTPGIPGGVGTTVSFSFLQAQAGFAPTIGIWTAGVGFENVSGDLTVIGGYFMQGITRVTLRYNAAVGGELEFGLPDGVGGYNFLSGAGYSDCVTVCSIIFSPPAVDSDLLVVAMVSQPDGFELRGIEVVFGGTNESYSVNDAGCPVLSPEQLAKLDPSFFAACSRCFTTPTPARSNQLSTVVLPFPTEDATLAQTFVIPVIVSGTAVTRTPGFPPCTFCATASPTVAPSPTPGGNQYNFDFTQNTGGWTVSAVGFNATVGHYTSVGWQSDYVVSTGEGNGFQAIGIHLHLPTPATVYGIYAEYTWVAGTTDRPDDHPNIVFVAGANILLNEVPPGASPAAWVGTQTGISDILVQGASGFTNAGANPGGSFLITRVILTLDTAVLPTATPSSTAAATVTGAPWLTLPPTEEVECSVAVFRDDTPVASFPDVLTTVDYQCYTLVPEVHLSIPDHPLDVDGVQVCVTWFEMPIITILGIQFTMDIVLLAVAAFLFRLLLKL